MSEIKKDDNDPQKQTKEDDDDIAVLVDANTPYYLANFMRIVNDVTNEKSQFRAVLLTHELAFVESMRSLSAKAQQLYVRLFLRKPGWLLHSKIKYDDIAEDCMPLFAELQKCSFVEDSLDSCSLEEMLRLAANSTLKDLCKQQSIKFTTGEEARRALATVGAKQKSFWGAPLATVIKKNLKKLMGTSVRLALQPRECFTRIMALFGLATSTFDSVFEVNSTSVGPAPSKKSRNPAMHPVYGMLLSDIGDQKYCAVEVSATCPIFKTRAHLERFEHAQRLEMAMFDAWSQKNVEKMMVICREATKLYKQYESDGLQVDDGEQPLHLRNLSAGWRLVRVIEVGVEAFQRSAYQNKTGQSRALKRKAESSVEKSSLSSKIESRRSSTIVPVSVIELDDDGELNCDSFSTKPSEAASSVGAEQKLHVALEAIEILETVLLRQKIYCMHHRGDWYDRLALIYERYHPESTKYRQRAFEVVGSGLRDESVRLHQRYTLNLRGERLKKQLVNNGKQQRGGGKKKLKVATCVENPIEIIDDADQYFPKHSVEKAAMPEIISESSTGNDAVLMPPLCSFKKPVEISIEGRRIQHNLGGSGLTRSIFVRLVEQTSAVNSPSAVVAEKIEDLIITQRGASPTPSTSTSPAPAEMLCSVEQFTLAHFRENGFPRGLHAEGSLIRTLIGLTFWDVIFAPLEKINSLRPSGDGTTPLESIFCSAFQTAPLDLLTAERNYFAKARRHLIVPRLNDVRTGYDSEDFKNLLRNVWESNFGTMCVFVNWELFESFEDLCAFCDCLELPKFADLCEYFLSDPRCLCAGFPDLMCWNTETKALKIIEVKGPGDSLSAKQIVWLDFLVRTGFDACVCYVKVSASGKELKKEEAVDAEYAGELKSAATSTPKTKRPAARRQNATTSSNAKKTSAGKSTNSASKKSSVSNRPAEKANQHDDDDIICLD